MLVVFGNVAAAVVAGGVCCLFLQMLVLVVFGNVKATTAEIVVSRLLPSCCRCW